MREEFFRGFVVDFPFSLIPFPACKGNRLFVVDFLFPPGFLHPPPAFGGVTGTLLLTLCFLIIVCLPPLLVCSGDCRCLTWFLTRTFRSTDSGAPLRAVTLIGRRHCALLSEVNRETYVFEKIVPIRIYTPVALHLYATCKSKVVRAFYTCIYTPASTHLHVVACKENLLVPFTRMPSIHLRLCACMYSGYPSEDVCVCVCMC